MKIPHFLHFIDLYPCSHDKFNTKILDTHSWAWFLSLFFLLSCTTPTPPIHSQDSPPLDFTFIKGADVSYIPELEDLNVSFTRNNEELDLVTIYRRAGFNWMRLRLWNNPASPKGYNGLERTLGLAKRIKATGMKLLLDFHYSDTWADPENQEKPQTWGGLSPSDLTQTIRTFTKETIARFKSEGVLPDMVQLGNEIASGILWPTGAVGGINETNTQWENLGNLLKAARLGVSDALAPGDQVKIMIHTQSGADLGMQTWFFDRLTAQGVTYDVIGLSYYPFWSDQPQGKSLADLAILWTTLANKYQKPVILAETAYPWTLEGKDSQNNFVWQDSQLIQNYPATPEGQKNYLTQLSQTMKNLNFSGAKGWFYWAPDSVAAPGFPTSWENLTLFDFEMKSLPGLEAGF